MRLYMNNPELKRITKIKKMLEKEQSRESDMRTKRRNARNNKLLGVEAKSVSLEKQYKKLQKGVKNMKLNKTYPNREKNIGDENRKQSIRNSIRLGKKKT